MRLSLVIPAYNEEATIGACLKSVSDQIRPFDEVIIVDNNSTDNTRAVALAYADRLPVTVIEESRQGVFWAREAGFSAASGEVIARIDADTMLESQWSARVMRCMSEHPDVAGIVGASYIYDTPVSDRRRAGLRKTAIRFLRERRVLYGATLSGNNMAVRRDAWQRARKHQQYAPGMHEDIDLSFAMDMAGARLVLMYHALAGVSPRRFCSSPLSTVRYSLAILKTIEVHRGRGSRYWWFALVGMPITVSVTLAMGVLAQPYDPQTGRWRPFRSTQAGRLSPVEKAATLSRV